MDGTFEKRDSKRKDIRVEKKRDDIKKDMLPPRKMRSEAAINGGAVVNKGAHLKASTPVRRDEKGNQAGINRRDGIGARKGSDSLSTTAGDTSPARVKGMINGLLSRKRTDSVSDQGAARADDGGEAGPRKPTLSFKLAHEDNALYDPFSSPRGDPLSPRPATARGDESSYPLSPRDRDLTGNHHGATSNSSLDVASAPSPSMGKRRSQDAESLRNALAKEVQSSNNLREKLALTQKKFDFLERNREELAQLLAQLRQELGDAASGPTPLVSDSGSAERDATADVAADVDADVDVAVLERRRSDGSVTEAEKRARPRSGSALELDEQRRKTMDEGTVDKRDAGADEGEDQAEEGSAKSPSPESQTDQHAALSERVMSLVDQAVALSAQTWERTEEARKEKEREDRKQALRQERDKKRANKQRERQLREERRAKKEEEEAGPRKITLGGAKRNSAGYSYGTAPIDLAKAGRTASSLMRIAKGRFSPAPEKNLSRKASTYTLDDIRHMYNDARKGGRGYVREAGKDLGPSAVAVIGHGERKTSPVQTRRFRRRSEPVSLINLPNSATNPSQAAPKPDKTPVDVVLKPASFEHLVVHQQQTQKLHGFLRQREQSRRKHSQQDLLDLLGDSSDDDDGNLNNADDDKKRLNEGVAAPADGDESRSPCETENDATKADADSGDVGETTTTAAAAAATTTKTDEDDGVEPNEAEYRLVASRLLRLEHELCHDLELVVTQFWRLLSDGGSEGQELLAGGRVARLFANVEMVWALHRHLLSALERTKRLPVADQDIAACFAATVEHKWMYETYSKELRQLMVVVDSATYHPDSLFRQAGYSRAELIAHLQRPLQNLLAYPHLLTELRHCAGTRHRHGDGFARVIAALSAVAFGGVTAQPLLSSEQISIWSVQHTFHWLDDALDLSGNSNRAVLREGTFNKLSSRGEIICRRVFLFNDLVLVARVLQTRQCLLKAAIPLARCLLYDCGEGSNAFELAVAGGEERAVLMASSREEKESWMEELTRCLLTHHSHEGIADHNHPDDGAASDNGNDDGGEEDCCDDSAAPASPLSS
ncbi:PH domain containing protein [Acanthamoeba castellanii str. Neff]|uniref:PH domain containing protein n=1 Tax=Acanthamoeba castellanii (strain ATCC 30010 / Neff) TaxID=1257118 RepID=L8GIK9_ACACF|nr:PH domain containing protein [Acanthamoeba castellanii str. Neff]ELR12011.1 PH domain containing protein [Acanthamoeba castellanii str. Neff]